MLESILLLTAALVGLLLSYLLVTSLNVSGESDPALSRDLQQVSMQTSTVAIEVIFLPVKGTFSILIDLLSMGLVQAKWTIAFGFFTACALLMHYYHYEILSIANDSWTCSVLPIVDDIVTPLLQISRVGYAALVPIGNAYLVIHGQIFKGWYYSFARCGMKNLFLMVFELGHALITGIHSLTDWIGISAGGVDNMLYNDFVIASPVNHTLTAVSLAQISLSCACKRFVPVFNIAFSISTNPHVTAAIDNYFQSGIRLFQMFFRTMLLEFPDIFKVSFKFERAIMETGLAMDGILFDIIENIVKMFEPDFTWTKKPAEGLLTTGSHLAAAGLHTAAAFTDGLLHLLYIGDPKQSAFNTESWSLGNTMSHLNAAVHSNAVFAQWFVFIVEQLITVGFVAFDAAVNAKGPVHMPNIFSGDDVPLELSCDWARDVKEGKRVSLPYTVGCSMYSLGTIHVNAPFILWGLAIDLLFNSIFTQEQALFRTLQRWEGPSLPRDKIYTCEERSAASAYDYTTSTYVKTGWLWSQDLAKCQCDLFYGRTRSETETWYQPWCGQPNLNFDLFAPMDAFVMHVAHGVLGPGFGDSIAYAFPSKSIKFEIPGTKAVKVIPVSFLVPPISRSSIEALRLVSRVVFSFGDIVTGNFFNYPVNCGHGLNTRQLEARWVSTMAVKETAGLTDGELRWDPCKPKAYSAMTGGKRTPLCDGNNEESDCMCSYMSPISLKSGCKCIARYPDLDVTASSQQVGDLIEDRFTSEDISMHWCNSMLVEWTFQNTAKFADALDYIVSLGPINPTCDVIDRIIDQTSVGTDEVDQRSASTYLIATTPTLRFTGEFMDTDSKMNHISDLYSNSDTGCGIVNGPGGAEWVCGNSPVHAKATSVTEMDEKVDADTAGCKIWGRTDFFCSAGLYVRNTKRLNMNIARQLLNDGISIIAGNYADINLGSLPRLCDFERQQGSIAAMVAGVIPGISIGLKKAFAKYMNLILQLMNVQLVRTGLVIVNVATTIVQDFVAGSVTADNLEQTFKMATETLVDGFLWKFGYFFETTGEFLDAVAPGSGEICHSIKEIIDMVQSKLKEGLLDMVGLAFKLTAFLFALLTGDTEVIDEFFVDFFKFVDLIMKLLIQQMFAILDKIYEFFGPIGEFFKLLSSTVCMLLNVVMGAIDGALSWMGGIGWVPMECPDPTKVLESSFNHTAGRVGRHFLKAEHDHDLPRRIAESLDWNGSSVCDHFMSAAADYSYSDLRPLEKSKWLECLELKLLGVELRKYTQLKNFPTDIAYNWKRKYIMVYDFARAIRIAIPHFLATEMDWAHLRLMLYDEGLDADMYMMLFQKGGSMLRQFISSLEATGFLEVILENFDKDYQTDANPSASATTWRVFKTAGGIYTDISNKWATDDMSKQMWKAVDTTYDAHTHLHRWWNALGTENQPTQTSTERVFSSLKSHWKKSRKPLKTAKHGKGPIHWLRVPIQSSLHTCAQRTADTKYQTDGWCTECSIIDNVVETTVDQAVAMANFYGHDFRGILNNVSDYFDFTDSSDFFDTRLQKSKSEPKKESVPATAARWSVNVANDWVYFVGNFSGYLIGQTSKKAWLHELDKFLNATRSFFKKKDGAEYVSYFGYNLNYAYTYFLFGYCNFEDAIWTTTSTVEQRLDRMDDAFIACLIVAIIISTTTKWSVLPLLWMTNIVIMGAILSFMYMYIVYGYTLPCAPLLPNMFMEDIFHWYKSRLIFGCFYKILPFMAINATDASCSACSTPDSPTLVKMEQNKFWSEINASTFDHATGNSSLNFFEHGWIGKYHEINLGTVQTFINCAEYTVNNYQPGMLPLSELIEQYSIFWPSLFWVRWSYPGFMKWIIQNGIVAFDTTLGKLAMTVWQDETIDLVWIDCYYAMWLDNVLVAVLIFVLMYIFARLTVILIQICVQACVLIWYVYTSLGYMTLAVEMSVTTKKKIKV